MTDEIEIQHGKIHGQRTSFLDKPGVTIWFPYDDTKEQGTEFSISSSDIDDLIALLQELKGAVTPRPAVGWFAEQMELRLRANDHKGGWKNCRVFLLLNRLFDEARELYDAVCYAQSDTKNIIQECADIANFAMMIADNIKEAKDDGKTR